MTNITDLPAPVVDVISDGSLAVDAGVVIAPLMILGAILKHAFPAFPNRLIPAVTLVAGVPLFMFKSGDVSMNGFVTALLVSITAVGVHSGIKNTFNMDAPAITTPKA